MDEDKLIASARMGDPSALNTLLGQYQDRVYRLAYRTLGNDEDAKDSTQEVLLRLARSIANFRGESRFSTWVYRLAYNTCLDFRRRRKTFERMIPLADMDGESGNYVMSNIMADTDPDLKCQKQFREKLLSQALASLSESQRTVLWLRDWEGLSNKEVAQAIGVSEGTLKARLHRARGALRRTLAEGVAVPGHEQFGRFQVTGAGYLE